MICLIQVPICKLFKTRPFKNLFFSSNLLKRNSICRFFIMMVYTVYLHVCKPCFTTIQSLHYDKICAGTKIMAFHVPMCQAPTGWNRNLIKNLHTRELWAKWKIFIQTIEKTLELPKFLVCRKKLPNLTPESLVGSW